MRQRRHPLSGAVYDVRSDGLIDVVQGSHRGVFDANGRWLEGDLTHADPQFCGWLAGRQLPSNAAGNPKDLPPTMGRAR